MNFLHSCQIWVQLPNLDSQYGGGSPLPLLCHWSWFRNPWQSIRFQSIWSPLYPPNNLYHVVRRHKCPQHRPTQQGYSPVQFPERRVSPKSTQDGLSLWSRVGMTSFPHHLIFITHCGSLDNRSSRRMMIPYQYHSGPENWRTISRINTTSE